MTKCITVGALVVEIYRILRGEVSLSLLAAGDVLMLEPYRYYEFIGRCSTLDERSSEKSCPFGRGGMSILF